MRFNRISFLILFLFLTFCFGDQQQCLQLFTDSCFGAPNWTFTENKIIRDINGSSIGINANGLWKVNMTSYSGGAGLETIQSGFGHDGDCSHFLFIPDPIDIARVIRYGDIWQNDTSVHFYPEKFFRGKPQIVTKDGISNTLIKCKSYFFTGDNSWEITTLDGNTSCLNHKLPSGYNYGFTHEDKMNQILSITTVKFGCTEPTISTTNKPNEAVPSQPFSILLILIGVKFAQEF